MNNDQDGCFIIDTGATASITSKEWFDKHLAWLKENNMKAPEWKEVKTPFRFGNGNSETLTYSLRIQDNNKKWSNTITTPIITVNK